MNFTISSQKLLVQPRNERCNDSDDDLSCDLCVELKIEYLSRDA